MRKHCYYALVALILGTVAAPEESQAAALPSAPTTSTLNAATADYHAGTFKKRKRGKKRRAGHRRR